MSLKMKLIFLAGGLAIVAALAGTMYCHGKRVAEAEHIEEAANKEVIKLEAEKDEIAAEVAREDTDALRRRLLYLAGELRRKSRQSP